MRTDLSTFSAAIASQGYWIADQVIDEDLRGTLLTTAQALFEQNAFRQAQVGKGPRKRRIEGIRGDMIYWLDDWSTPPLTVIKCVLDDILIAAKRELYLPLKRYESHFVLYPRGALYKKHVDQHRRNPSRILSCVLYLGDWHPGDGGELILHWPQTDRPAVTVEPHSGRLIVFESKILHEVQLTNAPRWSLTSWFRDDLHPNIVL